METATYLKKEGGQWEFREGGREKELRAGSPKPEKQNPQPKMPLQPQRLAQNIQPQRPAQIIPPPQQPKNTPSQHTKIPLPPNITLSLAHFKPPKQFIQSHSETRTPSPSTSPSQKNKVRIKRSPTSCQWILLQLRPTRITGLGSSDQKSTKTTII